MWKWIKCHRKYVFIAIICMIIYILIPYIINILYYIPHFVFFNVEYTPNDFLNYYSSLIVAVGTLSLAGLAIYQNRKIYEQEALDKIELTRPIFNFSYEFRDEKDNQYVDIIKDNINNGMVRLLAVTDCKLYINGSKSEYTRLKPVDPYASEDITFEIVEKNLEIAKNNLTILSFHLFYRDLLDYGIEEIYEVYRYPKGSSRTIIINRKITTKEEELQ